MAKDFTLQNKLQEILPVYNFKTTARIGFDEGFWDLGNLGSIFEFVGMEFTIVILNPIYFMNLYKFSKSNSYLIQEDP
ncbi:MAG: hypothetical protein Q8K26_03850, partial [Candidatus Gracilibacteria bacterium]|nr:hypothetical protein [Candidatus Gracilibacteria bacterium]